MSALCELLCCCCGGSSTDSQRFRSNVVDWRQHPLVCQYELLKIIGEGGFAEVWEARHMVTGTYAAMKVVYLARPGLSKEQAAVLEGEAKYLLMLDHPSIIHCIAVFETKFDLVLLLELLEGGELLDQLHVVHHFDEAKAAGLFCQIVKAIAYMHDLEIIHRDIKPENVMFIKPVSWYVEHEQPLKVKLIDLGMAHVLGQGGVSSGCIGSPGFMSPEVVRGGEHTKAMDIYALGVLLFVLLTGRKPFDLRDVNSLQYARKPLKEAPGLTDGRFLACSAAAQNLIHSMLGDDPCKRPTARQVLAHPWSRGEGGAGGRVVIDPLVARRMMQLAALRRYKGLAFALMMNTDSNGATVGSISRNSRAPSLTQPHPQPHLSQLDGPHTQSRLPQLDGPNPRSHLLQLDSIQLHSRPAQLDCSTLSVLPSDDAPWLEEIQGRAEHSGPWYCPTLSRTSSASGDSNQSFLAKRPPSALLKAIQMQRRVMHNSMRRRARDRARDEASLRNGNASGVTPSLPPAPCDRPLGQSVEGTQHAQQSTQHAQRGPSEDVSQHSRVGLLSSPHEETAVTHPSPLASTLLHAISRRLSSLVDVMAWGLKQGVRTPDTSVHLRQPEFDTPGSKGVSAGGQERGGGDWRGVGGGLEGDDGISLLGNNHAQSEAASHHVAHLLRQPVGRTPDLGRRSVRMSEGYSSHNSSSVGLLAGQPGQLFSRSPRFSSSYQLYQPDDKMIRWAQPGGGEAGTDRGGPSVHGSCSAASFQDQEGQSKSGAALWDMAKQGSGLAGETQHGAAGGWWGITTQQTFARISKKLSYGGLEGSQHGTGDVVSSSEQGRAEQVGGVGEWGVSTGPTRPASCKLPSLALEGADLVALCASLQPQHAAVQAATMLALIESSLGPPLLPVWQAAPNPTAWEVQWQLHEQFPAMPIWSEAAIPLATLSSDASSPFPSSPVAPSPPAFTTAVIDNPTLTPTSAPGAHIAPEQCTAAGNEQQAPDIAPPPAPESAPAQALSSVLDTVIHVTTPSTSPGRARRKSARLSALSLGHHRTNSPFALPSEQQAQPATVQPHLTNSDPCMRNTTVVPGPAIPVPPVHSKSSRLQSAGHNPLITIPISPPHPPPATDPTAAGANSASMQHGHDQNSSSLLHWNEQSSPTQQHHHTHLLLSPHTVRPPPMTTVPEQDMLQPSSPQHSAAQRSTGGGGGHKPGPAHAAMQAHAAHAATAEKALGAMDLALVATALHAAPQLTRCWSCPQAGAMPNLLANALGAGTGPGKQWSGMEGMLDSHDGRAMSLCPLALAFMHATDHHSLHALLGAGDVFCMKT